MKIVKEFVLREIAGEAILVPTGKTSQEFNGMINLSPTAAVIWQNLEKVDSLDEMLNIILDEFDVDKETALTDIIGFIRALIEKGYVITSKEDKSW